MKLRLEINADNAAFDDNRGAELARIMRIASDKIQHILERKGERYVFFDSNGYLVGYARLMRGKAYRRDK